MPVAAAESQHPFAVYRVLHSANQVLSRHSPANKSELRMNYGSMYWQINRGESRWYYRYMYTNAYH